MYLFLGLILLLPMLALRRRREDSGNILDEKSTTCIKGILCLYVMVHNLGMDLPNGQLKELICEHVGGIGVGVFFFLSAFGIIRSYQARGNRSVRSLLLVHIPKMWLVAVFINTVTYFAFFRGQFQPADLWLRLLNLDFFNNFNRMNLHGWYIASIIALYLIFALVYFTCSKLKTKNKFYIACMIMVAVAIGARVLAVVCDTGRLYTRQIPTFAFGCLYATFYDSINRFAKKHFVPGMILTVAAILYGIVFSEPLATYCAAAVIVLVSQKCTYYSKITFFLGKICLGVYLWVHFSSLVMSRFLHREYLWMLTNAGFVLAAAIAIYAVQRAASTALRRIRSV